MNKRCRAERGLALVMVLWVVMLLAIMASSFIDTTRIETRLVSQSLDRAQALAAAEAGMAYALYRQLKPLPEQPWPADGRVYDWKFDRLQMAISLRDASGKIDINHANSELFKGLLISVGGLDEEDAEALLDKIEDFRDPDDLRRPQGAESADYALAGRPVPKNAPFESVDELQQVLDMPASVHTRIAAALTVHSYQAGINPEAAPARVLYALPDVDPDLVADYVQQRRQHWALEPEQPVPSFPQAGAFQVGPSGVYHVQVKVLTETGATVQAEAVLAGQGRRGDFSGLSAWREDQLQRLTPEQPDQESIVF